MHSVVPMRIAKISHVVLSLLLFAIGIVLVVKPTLSVTFLEKFCGVFLILFGASKIVGYLSKDLYRLAFEYDFVFGFIIAGIGLIFLIRPDSLLMPVCIPLGIVIFGDGVIKIQVARHAKRFGISAWWAIFALAVLAVIGGMFLAIYPLEDEFLLATILGVILMIESVLSAVTVLTSVKIQSYAELGYLKKHREDLE